MDHHKLLKVAMDLNNDVVSIYAVESGEKCGCYCLICKETLIAKNVGKGPNVELKNGQKQAHYAQKMEVNVFQLMNL